MERDPAWFAALAGMTVCAATLIALTVVMDGRRVCF